MRRPSFYAGAFPAARPQADPAPAGQLAPLRFLTCGSVDDGKSTLIGRLLYDTGRIYDDHLAALARDSRRFGTAGDEIDFALLTDGLEDERSQGITIDVAYRFFATGRRAFIVADSPGHEQYTRNMATAASTADCAVILVDARKGVLPQTRRHAFICALMGIRDTVLAVNKIDLVGWDEAVFRTIVADFGAVADHLGLRVTAIPICARGGDNLGSPSAATPWYQGPPLLAHLETLEPAQAGEQGGFRFPVQWVNRADEAFRGYAGTVRGGRVACGDTLVSERTGQPATVARIIGPDGDQDSAATGEAITLAFAEERDVGRGDLLSAAADRSAVADQFAAHLVWFAEAPLLAGREYLLKIGTATVPATVTAIRHTLDVTHFARLAAETVHANEIAVCNLAASVPVPFDPYAANRHTGSFILIDRSSLATVAAGMIDFPLRRAANLHLQKLTVDRQARAALLGQAPAVLWFTGLSGSGKSTIADIVERRLHARGRASYLLDGDNMRHGISRDLGFTDADRVENIRRAGEMAWMLADAGLIVLCSFISPFRRERQSVRERLGAVPFLEIFVDTPLALCQARDPKGLYAKVSRGEIRNFTGIDSPYEPPEAPDLHLQTDGHSAEEAADAVIGILQEKGILS